MTKEKIYNGSVIRTELGDVFPLYRNDGGLIYCRVEEYDSDGFIWTDFRWFTISELGHLAKTFDGRNHAFAWEMPYEIYY